MRDFGRNVHDIARSERLSLAPLNRSASILAGLGGLRASRLAAADERRLAGHASIQMTMLYVHSTPDHKRNATLKFEAYCGSGSDALSAAKPSDGTSQTSTTEQLRRGLARITVVP